MKNLNKLRDLTGQKFGRLTVIGLKDTESRKTYWICQCDCGNIYTARSDALIRGSTKSCGCLKKEQDKINLTGNHTHKQSGTRLYRIWAGMKSRCYNEKELCYYRYGGKGVRVCDEWLHDFSAFYEWALNNGYSENLSIDRIDNNGNYEPSNCKWSTNKEQCNNRTTNIKIKIGNATKTLQEWCEIFEVDYRKTSARYHRHQNLTIEELFN